MSELTEAVDRLVSVYDGSPDTMGYMADRYPGLHHAIENVMVARTRTRDAEDIPVALVAQIQDGGKYLLGTARPVTALQAERMRALLSERFPHATFAIAGPDLRVQVEQRPGTEQQAVAALDALSVEDQFEARIEAESILLGLVPDSVQRAYGRYVRREGDYDAPNEPVDVPVPPTVLLPDLLAAVWRAEAAASAENAKATNENARTATYGACRALRLLARALAPDRDGAGAPSPAPSESDVATDPPAPSLPVLCATEHPTLQFLRCTLVQDHGPAENHYSAVHRVWWR